ncbi:Uncharacterised protein [Serratia quinivorans]|nr:Uncharacterised protein [Serratia quinivorans]CAI1248863.1 Uncharacterised protein [Serratia quinivorans]CAI2010823.1 Uncharacterised protein [Serratia quinivorans]CAI2031428.1 Uncharacterised protein [Serratia quinivorans]CAI2160686.1 Uncharacterised protein [Serratia quinivorans]
MTDARPGQIQGFLRITVAGIHEALGYVGSFAGDLLGHAQRTTGQ